MASPIRIGRLMAASKEEEPWAYRRGAGGAEEALGRTGAAALAHTASRSLSRLLLTQSSGR
jgi:hypothetical protein